MVEAHWIRLGCVGILTKESLLIKGPEDSKLLGSLNACSELGVIWCHKAGMPSRRALSDVIVHPQISLAIHEGTNRLYEKEIQVIYSSYFPSTAWPCGAHGQFPMVCGRGGANSCWLHMVTPPSLESGQQNTVSCFWDVPEDNSDEKSFQGTENCPWHLLLLWFWRRNVFQVRVHCGWLHGHEQNGI